MPPSADPLATLPAWRAYGVVGVMALAAVLLYLDRVCISFGDIYIREDLGLDKTQMGWVLGAFFFSYALAQVPSGWLSDRFGPRITLTLYILVWSLFTTVTGLAVGLVSLLAARLAFGVAQAGAYPTAAVLIGRWVPAASRGVASSVVALGGRVGGAVAPVLTAVLLTLLIPVNESRLETGDLLAPEQLVGEMETPGDETLARLRRRVRERLPASALPSSPNEEALRAALNDVLADPTLTEELDWSLVALPREARTLLQKPATYRTSAETERLNRLALEPAFPGLVRQLYGRAWREVMWLYGGLGLLVAAAFWLTVRDHPSGDAPRATRQGMPWLLLLRSRSMALSGLMQFGINIGWVFLITLLPRYLAEARVPIEERGTMAMVPLLAGCAGMLVGGRLTDALTIALGRRWGRALPIGLTQYGCAAACLACLWLDTPWGIVAALSVMSAAVDLGVPAIWAFVQDVGGRHTGAALGYGNMWGNLGAAVSPVLLSQVEVRGGWSAVFVTCAVAFAVAATAGLLIDARRPLEPTTT
jgi:MFS transporter, ACS family, glucarate transporter